MDARHDDHLLQGFGIRRVFIVQETVEVSKKVRWGHAHSVLESWTDLALDNAGVDPLNLFDMSFLHGLAPDRPDLFEGNGLEGDDRPSRCEP